DKINLYDKNTRRDSTSKKDNRVPQVDDQATAIDDEEKESENSKSDEEVVEKIVTPAEYPRSPAVALLARLLPLLVKRSDNNGRERSKDCSEDRDSSDCGGDKTNTSGSNKLSVSRLKILKSVALLLSTSNRKQ
ncbi:MAG: hypothetical protein MHMPM18_003945, partial [Marteilia pararefringens]